MIARPPGPARIDRVVVNQSPSQGIIEVIEDRTASFLECAMRLTQGRLTIGLVDFPPQMGGMMPVLERMNGGGRCIAVIRQLHDECLATPDDYPEAALAMRWAKHMHVPSVAPGWERYRPVIRIALQTPRVLMLETTEEKFPAWRSLWDATRAPDWKPRLSW